MALVGKVVTPRTWEAEFHPESHADEQKEPTPHRMASV